MVMIPIHVPARIHDIANVITKDLLTGTRSRLWRVHGVRTGRDL